MKVINLLFQTLISLEFSIFFLTAQKQIVQENFLKWQRKYNKTYKTMAAYRTALRNFRFNYMCNLRHQLKYYVYKSTFLRKMNKYSGYRRKSFLNGATFDDAQASQDNFLFDISDNDNDDMNPRAFNLPNYPAPPARLDYRDTGLVTNVDDQGLCSSCYAFAAACGIEGQIAKKTGKVRKISSQNILDCSGKYGNLGCFGGSIGISYRYVYLNQGIANETSYPYAGSVNTCAYNSNILSSKISSYAYVTGDENYLKSVLAAVGPLPVGMRGSLDSFYYYSSGIYDDTTCTGTIDHAVCLVGYGTDNTTSPPTDYWIVKNSWSTDWGENGYFRLKMGSNLCGIRNYVVYPIL